MNKICYKEIFHQFSIVDVLRKYLNLIDIFNLMQICKSMQETYSFLLEKNQSILKKWHLTDKKIMNLSLKNQFSPKILEHLVMIENESINFANIGVIVQFASTETDEEDPWPSHIVLSSNHKKNFICFPIHQSLMLNHFWVQSHKRHLNILSFEYERNIYGLNIQELLETQEINWKITKDYQMFPYKLSSCGNYYFERLQYHEDVILMKNLTKGSEKMLNIPSHISDIVNEELHFRINQIYGDVHFDEKVISLSVIYSQWRCEIFRLICFLLKFVDRDYKWEIKEDIILSEEGDEEFDLNCSSIYCPVEERFEILTTCPKSYHHLLLV